MIKDYMQVMQYFCFSTTTMAVVQALAPHKQYGPARTCKLDLDCP